MSKIETVEDYVNSLIGKTVTVVTPFGEIGGRLKSVDSDRYLIEDPRICMITQEGGSYVPVVASTSEQDPDFVAIPVSGSMITKLSEQAENNWRQVVSGIEIASSPKVH